MKIEVVSGTGSGLTELGAFDAAELEMGVANCNLIRLSSIIPPSSEVVSLDGPTTMQIGWGDKLYCIYADSRTSQPGSAAWAGVGWIMLEGNKGIFCEHEGSSREEVEQAIHGSLTSFISKRNMTPDPSQFNMKVTGITCEDKPVCALAMAVYRAESW